MLREVKLMLERAWEVEFSICSRDENVVDDLLSSYAMAMQMDFLSLVAPSSMHPRGITR